MLRIGLTGSIASGKSLFASFLARRGAVVVDADAIGHAAIRKDGAAYAGVVAAFGPAILDRSGEIDRAALGRIVFDDPAALLRLNRLVHPPLIAEIERQVAAAAAAGARVVVVDAALIYELGLGEDFDAVIAVTAPAEVQVERLAASRGMSAEEARQRIGAQLPAGLKAGRADFVVTNASSKEDLEREAERIWQLLATRVGREGRSGGLFKRKESGS